MYPLEHGIDSKNSNEWEERQRREERQRDKKKEECSNVSLPFMVYKLILASSDECQVYLHLRNLT